MLLLVCSLFVCFIFNLRHISKQDVVKRICSILWQASSQFLKIILISGLVNISYINKSEPMLRQFL